MRKICYLASQIVTLLVFIALQASSPFPSVALAFPISSPTCTDNRSSKLLWAKPGSSGDDTTEKVEKSCADGWRMRHGMLFSSFSDGVLPNLQAREWLQRGLIRSMLLQRQKEVEEVVEDSVKFSPCAGPDVVAIDEMRDIDEALRQLETSVSFLADWIRFINPLLLKESDQFQSLRIVYIPTAMYALRRESTNTSSGKQRQRARADGKKRRDEIVSLLQSLLPPIPIEVVTVDWEDGSVKQASVTSGKHHAPPLAAKEALTTWKPHLVYVQGGNTFWLYHCMEKGGWKDDLLHLLDREFTFYCGSSAGAILAGASMEPACWKEWDDCRIVPGRERYKDWSGVPGLSLVGDLSFFPHMTDNWQSVVDARRKGLNVLCLSDHDVCLVDGSAKSISFVTSPVPLLQQRIRQV